MKNARLSYLLLIFLLCECKPTNLRQPNSDEKQIVSYEEDLSLVRPLFNNQVIDLSDELIEQDADLDNYPTNVQSIHGELHSKIEAMVQKNKSIVDISGYRIQVFVGNNKDEFDSARQYILQNFPNAELYTSYSQPTYRLKMGDFVSKADAERFLSLLKMRFPMSKVIPDTVSLKNSLKLN